MIFMRRSNLMQRNAWLSARRKAERYASVSHKVIHRLLATFGVFKIKDLAQLGRVLLCPPSASGDRRATAFKMCKVLQMDDRCSQIQGN